MQPTVPRAWCKVLSLEMLNWPRGNWSRELEQWPACIDEGFTANT